MNISVLITSYNQELYLKEAIESVLNQTYKPYEIIICDDSSIRDNSRELILSYKNKYPNIVKPIFHDQNIGIAANRNSGFKAASGDFITTLDGDDRYLSCKLAIEADVLSRTNCDISYSNQTCIDKNGTYLDKIRYKDHKTLSHGWIFESVVLITAPGPRELLFPKKVFSEVGFLDENLKTYEDWDFLVRLSSCYRFAGTYTTTVEHRLHKDSIQHQTDIVCQLNRMIEIVERAGNIHLSSKVGKTRQNEYEKLYKKIQAFHLYLKARKHFIDGNKKAAYRGLLKSIAIDSKRSIVYELFLRLLFSRWFSSKSPIIDYNRTGPLKIPYYIAKEVYYKTQRF